MALTSVWRLPTFQTNVLSPSSGQNSKRYLALLPEDVRSTFLRSIGEYLPRLRGITSTKTAYSYFQFYPT
jgi:hypothetical protein